MRRSNTNDLAACRASIRAGSKSFFIASLLLPARVREPALALYAFCRLADDAVDVGTDPEALARLRERLDAIYAGRPLDHSADRALADVVVRHSIPKALLEGLLEGFEWDMQARRYEDAEQLHAYALRVAGTVGQMMAHLMDRHCVQTQARACDLGIAMQLTNIARDVGEDARAGRVYLPCSWLRQVNIDPDHFPRAPGFSQQLGQVIERLLSLADEYYERADAGIALLPRDCRAGILAARHLYAEIGHRLRRAGCDSIARRTVVPPLRKLFIVSRSVLQSSALGNPGARLDEHAEWLVELFDRLERRDRQPPDHLA